MSDASRVEWGGEVEGVCPRCRGRLPGSAARVCPWCDAVLDGSDSEVRWLKRAAIVGVVVVLLGAWALIVPPLSWTSTSGLVFGVVALFMTSMAWVLSGPMVDS